MVAVVIAMIALKKNDGRFGIKFADIFDLSLYAIPIAIIGTRIYFILFNLDKYLANPSQMLNFRSRWTSHIWGYNSWIYNLLHILQEKKNQYIRLTRLYCTIYSVRTSHTEE